jgi:hypothetical protein
MTTNSNTTFIPYIDERGYTITKKTIINGEEFVSYLDEEGNECVECPCNESFEQDENGYYCLGKPKSKTNNKNNKK